MFSRLLLSSFFFLLFSAFFVNGSSTRPRPLKRLAHPSSVSLKILPRTPNVDRKLTARDLNPQDLKYTDSLRLSLNAFADTFHLHLEPNHDLIHPAAKVEYYKPAPNGKGTVLDRVEPLQRETILVYGGKVIHNDHTEAALAEGLAGGVWRPNGVKAPGERGWARIMVHDAGDPLTGRPPIFEGAFSVDGVIHHVNTKNNYQRTKLDLDPDMEDEDLGDLVVFRDSDLFTVDEEEYIRTGRPVTPGAKKKPPTSCAHDRLGYNVDRNNPVLRYGAGLDRPSESSWLDPLGLVSPNERPGETINGTLVRRQGDLSGNNLNGNFVDSIGNTAGCPITQQIVYMGVVSDCSYTQQNGGGRNATQQILSNWNTVSLLYKSTFNVSLGIVTLQIEDGACPAQVDPNKAWNVPCGAVSLNERLSLFSAFRGARFDAGTDGNDVTGLWHLMSGCPSGTEVGVAWLGTVCMQQASGSAPSIVSGTGVSTGGRTEWQVIAHEIGHNFGAIHDCADGCSLSDDCCPLNANTCNSNAGFLMSPVSSASEQVFSPCTIGNICSLMLGNNIDMTCIQPPNPNQETFSLQMCGNGIVEGEEQCDPGVGAESACCDPATCRFRDNAVCDPLSSPCCSDTCQFAPATQVCRPSRDGQCDVEERCTGTSAACPADTTSPNGQSCGNNGLACANGICTSPSQQCRAVGSSLGLRDACPQSQQNCQISCQDPRNPQQCIVLNSQLVDGSPCGFGGTCVSGDCQSGSIIETAVSWYRQNLQIAIPVSVVVGIIILLILYAIIKAVFRCCCGGKKKKKPPPSTTEVIPSNVPANRIPSWPAPSRGSQTDLRPEPITHGRSGSGSYRPSPSPGRSVSPIPPARSLSPIPPVRAVSPISPVSNYTRSTSPAPPGRQYDSGPAPPPSLRPGNGFAPPPGAPSYPLPPSYGAEASRQSTWGGSAANAYSGGGRSLTDRQDNWVDDSIYNGRR